MRKTLSLLLALALLFTLVPAVSAETTDFDYSKEALEALDYINEIRQKAGVQPYKLDPFLTKAAENHLNYLAINGNSEGHREDPKKKGFTGVNAKERVESVGGSGGILKSIGEGISFSSNTVKGSVDVLIDAPLHRVGVLSIGTTHIGVAFKGKVLVLNYGGFDFERKDILTYPHDNQKDVPLGFYGFENPNPLEEFGVDETGYAILFSERQTISSGAKAKITDSKGKDVPFYQSAGHVLLYPKKELTPGETYTVTVEYTPFGGPDKGITSTKTWSFTTKGTPKKEKPAPIVVDPKDIPQHSKDNVGIMINGELVDFSPKAIIKDNSTFIPLRGVFEKMGAEVTWYQESKSVYIRKGKRSVLLFINHKVAQIDGATKEIAVAPFTIDGSTYVPLRFASEALGADVKWNQQKYVALITSE